MINFILNIFKDSFKFNEERFEERFFKFYYIPYKKKYCGDDCTIYTSRDLTYIVNSMKCVLLLNEKEILQVEFIHDMESDCKHLFKCVKKFY